MTTHKDELREILKELSGKGYGARAYAREETIEDTFTAITELFDKRFEKSLPDTKDHSDAFTRTIDLIKDNWKKESGV
jgi:hypothetical protein